MAIIVEDGTQVANANSYVDVADLRSFATARNRTLPAVDADCEPLLVRAFDYLENLRDSFKGTKVSFTQPSQWPRTGVWFDGASATEDMFPIDEIPIELIKAQCELACLDAGGTSPYATTTSGPFVIMEKLDVLQTNYSDKFGTSNIPDNPTADAFLAPLLNDSSFALQTVRV